MHPDFEQMIRIGSLAAVVAIGSKMAIVTAMYFYAALN
jgi:hypothetical protein